MKEGGHIYFFQQGDVECVCENTSECCLRLPDSHVLRHFQFFFPYIVPVYWLLYLLFVSLFSIDSSLNWRICVMMVFFNKEYFRNT